MWVPKFKQEFEFVGKMIPKRFPQHSNTEFKRLCSLVVKYGKKNSN